MWLTKRIRESRNATHLEADDEDKRGEHFVHPQGKFVLLSTFQCHPRKMRMWFDAIGVLVQQTELQLTFGLIANCNRTLMSLAYLRPRTMCFSETLRLLSSLLGIMAL